MLNIVQFQNQPVKYKQVTFNLNTDFVFLLQILIFLFLFGYIWIKVGDLHVIGFI